MLRDSAVVNRASRAGSANPTEFDAEQTGFLVDASSKLGFDVIKVDPNAIPKLPPRSHSFWFEDPWVSGDLLGLLLLNAEPQRSRLEPQVGPLGARYLTFSPDFDDRVQRVFAPRRPLQARASQHPPTASGADPPVHRQSMRK